ncbi:ABC transporter substrate-binding protein [Rhizobium leguminosarum]|uniref:ABC transporter substrate-binding protein n=1 Tax=Rhizobium leguminosarum TaxID=384 RepID=UPI001C95152B|nr:ABC transporter substrate-binding protein [Rhizobium leguminosarum]MBY5436546.1 ABC transporter substrate-binding protein [Rhizobium leguminosarum]
MFKRLIASALVASSVASSAMPANAAKDGVTLGFAVAFTGWEAAYDGEATKMAQLWIEQQNAKGGLLGHPIKQIQQDTKSDRVEGAKAGQAMVQGGADVVLVTADYDYGAPAALQAQKAGLISVFLGASDPKAGVAGVGKLSFTANNAGQVEGATMAEWGINKRGFKKGYVLVDNLLEYNKSSCAGYEWAFPLHGGTIVAKDEFKNADASISSQVTRLANAVRDEGVDNVMLCSVTPGGASAIKQIRAAGINIPILSNTGMDGLYWNSAVSDLKDFYVPVQAVFSGDPRPEVEALTKAYEAKYGGRPATQYAYPIYAWLDLYAQAVTKVGSTDAEKVVAEMNTYKEVPTVLGTRSFSDLVHIQTQIPMFVTEIKDGKQNVIEEVKISQDIPNDVLYRLKK